MRIRDLYNEYVLSEWESQWDPYERLFALMRELEELYIVVMRVNGWESLANGTDCKNQLSSFPFLVLTGLANPSFNSASYTIRSSFELEDDELFFGPRDLAVGDVQDQAAV